MLEFVSFDDCDVCHLILLVTFLNEIGFVPGKFVFVFFFNSHKKSVCICMKREYQDKNKLCLVCNFSLR